MGDTVGPQTQDRQAHLLSYPLVEWGTWGKQEVTARMPRAWDAFGISYLPVFPILHTVGVHEAVSPQMPGLGRDLGVVCAL